MVAAELSRTRADHRRRMEAKVKAKAARTPLLPFYKENPTPLRKYGRYQLPGTGHLLSYLLSWRITSSSTLQESVSPFHPNYCSHAEWYVQNIFFLICKYIVFCSSE